MIKDLVVCVFAGDRTGGILPHLCELRLFVPTALAYCDAPLGDVLVLFYSYYYYYYYYYYCRCPFALDQKIHYTQTHINENIPSVFLVHLYGEVTSLYEKKHLKHLNLSKNPPHLS